MESIKCYGSLNARERGRLASGLWGVLSGYVERANLLENARDFFLRLGKVTCSDAAVGPSPVTTIKDVNHFDIACGLPAASPAYSFASAMTIKKKSGVDHVWVKS